MEEEDDSDYSSDSDSDDVSSVSGAKSSGSSTCSSRNGDENSSGKNQNDANIVKLTSTELLDSEIGSSSARKGLDALKLDDEDNYSESKSSSEQKTLIEEL